jgi:hypothetical protein
MSLLAKIVRRGPRELLITGEAVALLAFFRACLAMIPVRKIIGTITHGRAGAGLSDESPAAERDFEVARHVQWAVSAAARHSVLEFVCFPQTLAAYTMLRRRGVASTMLYGVARSPEGDLIAHTWLMVGDGTVVGAEGAGGFTVVERWR